MRKCSPWRHVTWVTKVITIALTFVTLVTMTSASKCPDKCHCSKQRVICEHQRINSVPAGIPTDTLYLYIGWNQITRIQASDFKSLVNLETLSLKKNVIYEIEDGAFSKNTKLNTIFLTDNILANVSAEAFQGLSSLQKLYLTNNRLITIPDLRYATSLKKLNLDTNKIKNATFPLSYRNLKSLGQVILTDNPGITEITANTFDNIRNAPITKMSLGRCSITKIANNSFAGLTSLQSLSVAYNKISTADINNFIQGFAGSRIHSLDLSGVFHNLNYLPNGTFAVMGNVQLFTLSLAHSEISVLEDMCFKGLSQLTLLDLSNVKITATEAKAFEGLHSLKVLKLYHNRLATIPSNLPPSLQTLDISHNLDIDELPDKSFIALQKLNELRIHDCGIVQVHSGALWGVENLKILDLSHNQMGGNNIGVKVMQNLQLLTELYLQGNKLSTINKETRLFEGLSNLALLDMSNSQCSVLSDGLFHPLKKLQVLKLENNQLGRQLSKDVDGSTFEGLFNLRELYLERNEVETLPAALFKNLQVLEKLVLKNNQLYHWESELFKPLNQVNLTVDLSMNQVSLINETSLLYVKPSTKLNLSSNPFNCGCDLVWFRHWFAGNNETLLNLTSYTCKSPSKMEGLLLVDFAPEAIWISCHWLEILYACIGTVFLLTAVSAGVMYRYRWKIMVHYYFARRYLRHLKKTPQTDGDTGQLVVRKAEYDAILSSDEGDEDFVETFLLPNISVKLSEDGVQDVRHHICYPKGDIEWGQPQSAFADMAQPDKSDKILVVLSERYMMTLSKADFELGVARHRRREEGKQVIIIIFIGTPELHAKAPADIQMLLNDDQCVIWKKQWQEYPDNNKDAIQVFYEKVRDLLDKPVPSRFLQNIQA